uniref:Roller-3 N-terminal domain-containing protein n=1 Tax=Parascaris equorum TaxID=6256 RepID=A0A914S8I9_PAREQ
MIDLCCREYLVLPLSRGSLDWDEPLLVANLSERTNACHIGCQDLESVNSTCDERCNRLVAIDSCMQGCRAVSDIFLHQIQDLLYHVSISIDGEDAQGISTTWKFDEVYGTVISEISATDIQWAVQSRPFGSGSPWQITILEEKAFKEDSMQSKIVVPSEFASEIEVRLCIFWRSNMVVSRPIRQSIVGAGGRARAPKLIAQLQISLNSYVNAQATV